jgi:hypothetical protein
MIRKAAVALMAGLLLGNAAWGSEPNDADPQTPSMLPAPTASLNRPIISEGTVQGLVTPSSTIFVSTPDSTPAYDMSLPNVIGGLQAGSSLGFVPGGVGRIPLISRSAFTVGDNESPTPQNRIFFDYNYFNDVKAGNNLSDVNRETFGVERTFCDDRASIGLRVPFVQTSGNDSDLARDNLGDLSAILKIALIKDRDTGLLLSSGLVVTAPTGKSIPTVAGDLHPTLIQPFVGYEVPFADRAFVQGFSSIIVPTDSRDTTLWTGTLSLGYWLYRCDNGGTTVRSIAPAVEAQIATPFDHRDSDSLIHYPDVLSFTTGVHVGLWHRSTLTVGASTPVIGPRPYEVGAVAQFNMKF